MFNKKSSQKSASENNLIKKYGGKGNELMLGIDKAKKFADDQGYALLPTQQTIYQYSFSVTTGTGSRSTTVTSIDEIRITEKVGYFKKGSREMGTVLCGGPNGHPQRMRKSHDITITESVGRYKIGYESNKWIKALVRAAEFVTISQGQIVHYKDRIVYDNWSHYPNDKNLINEFAKRHGKTR